MRERSTWNRSTIAAASKKVVADDPRAMNQDHLKQQPAADKYVIGDPSDFAEGVHPSTDTWKAEYSGGEVKRNELGMPEMRSDTFNHPEKTAAQQDAEDDEVLAKKASLCIKLAQRVLPKTASETMLEDQALAFMHMPNTVLIDTYTRLADDQGQQQDQGKQAQDQQQTQQDGKQAGEVPPQFLEHMKKKDDDKGDDKGQQDQGKQAQDQQSQQQSEEQKKQAQAQQQSEEEQKKQAQQQSQQSDEQQQKQAALAGLARKACDAMAQGDMQLAQQQIQQMVQQSMGPQQTLSQDQIQQMVQQAMQQQGQPAQQQQPAVMADDQLLDQMLQTDVQASRQVTASSVGAASMDIEIEGPSMDVGEVHLGSDDEALTALFASSPEVQEAAHAHALQTGIPVQASAGMTRTAATRTVGTRPSGGVASLGGAVPAASGGDSVDKLSGLWQSAPDVRSIFNT